MITPTLVVAKRFFEDEYISPFLSPFYPLILNPEFSPSLEEEVFKKLGRSNIYRAQEFISEGRRADWANLEIDGTGKKLDSWHLGQLLHYVKMLSCPTRFERLCSSLEPP